MTSADASVAQFLQRSELELGGTLYINSNNSLAEHQPDPVADDIQKFVPARTRDHHSSTCPPGSVSQPVSMTRQQAQQARSRNSTPPPAPRRCTLPDVPAPQETQRRPAAQADQSKTVPTCCSKLRRLFAALVFVFLLLGSPALLESVTTGFSDSAALKHGNENPAVRKIAAFASLAKVAVVDRVTESPAVQKLVKLATSSKQAMMDSPALQRTFELTASIMQKLEDMTTSAKKSLLEAVKESPALEKASELVISAKEAVLNFCSMLCSWAQSMHPTEKPSSPQAAVDAECTGPGCQPEWQVAQPIHSIDKPLPLQAAVVEKPSPPQPAADTECTRPDFQPGRQEPQPIRSTEKPPPVQDAADAECIGSASQLECAGLQDGKETPDH